MNTVKMETKELTGSALDWAVCIALGWRRSLDPLEDCGWRGEPAFEGDDVGALMAGSEFSPSTNWAHGGPLIDEFNVSTVLMGEPLTWTGIIGVEFDAGNNLTGLIESTGSTPLIASCRAIVQSKLGRQIDIPEDLQGGKEHG